MKKCDQEQVGAAAEDRGEHKQKELIYRTKLPIEQQDRRIDRLDNVQVVAGPMVPL
jgi:hypothetical protein